MVTPQLSKKSMANEATETLLGYSRGELIGMHTVELGPQGEAHDEKAKQLMTQLYEEGTVTGFELAWLRKDGSLIDAELNIALLRSKGGNSTGAVGSIRDITQRKRVEETLIKSEKRYHSLIENASDAIISINKEGLIISFNKKAEEMFGYTHEEIEGKSIILLSPPSTRERQRKLLEEFKANNKLYIVGNTQEGKGLRKGGQEFPFEGSAFFLEINGEDILTVILRDITERKKAETEIREAKEFLENLFTTSSDAILVTDPQGNVTMVNEAVESITGYSRDDLLGKHVSMLMPLDEGIRSMMDRDHEKFFKEGKVSGSESVWQRKDGKHIVIESNKSLLKDKNGQVIGAVGFYRDVSQRKRVERMLIQSEKLKSLGELSGGVAHDFNNVLAAILGRVQLLKMNIQPPPGIQEKRKTMLEMKRGLEIIERAALDGAETVRRIQEFSRRREDDKNLTTIDLNEVIDHALEFTSVKWKNEAESKGIQIIIQKELSPLPPTVGSASELREVFTNLINNAIDAMPQGGRIKIKTFRDNSHIAIKVEDTGIRIPKGVKDKIFDPFFTTKGVQSTGLGLSVTYGIINRHRGTISVDSVEDQGTTFTIKLPFTKRNAKEEKVQEVMSVEQRKGKILVIEDEADVRELLSDILSNGGHEVDTASDGNQGIALFKKKEYDLVFTNLGMPGMSGWQVAEEIKKINRKIPIVLITGWEVKLNESEMRESGVDLVVNKPFVVDQVLKLAQEGMQLKNI